MSYPTSVESFTPRFLLNVTKEYNFVSYQACNFLNVRANPIFANRCSCHSSYLRTEHVKFVPVLG